MNSILKINQINQKELSQGTSYEASWHYDYKDTSYIYIGSLPYDFEEKDVLTIFSQYGIPTHINLVRDRATGASRGFCYLKYENYKSCVLAVDNLNGIKVYDRVIKVDHVYFKLRGDDKEENYLVDYSEIEQNIKGKIEQKIPKLLDYKEQDKDEQKQNEIQSETKIREQEQVNDDEFKDPMTDFISKKDVDDEFKDPMADYISKGSEEKSKKSHRHSRHRSHRSHRSRSDKSGEHRSRSDKREDDQARAREKSPSRD